MIELSLCNRQQFEFSEIRLSPLPNEKFLDWSKLKDLADDKINVTEKLKFVLGRAENIVGKAENAASYQHFLIFLQYFQKTSLFFSRVVKSQDCVVKSFK